MVTLDHLLEKTSRTFALAIPLLPQPQRTEVTLGYLVFRIADTFEDADHLSRDERIAGLEEFSQLLETDEGELHQQFAHKWAARHLTDSADYQELLEQTPLVLTALSKCNPAAKQTVVRYAQQSIAGMAETLASGDTAGRVTCSDVEALQQYCYYVAGLVGEMLTELFRHQLGDRSLESKAAMQACQEVARNFGEGLQLVNILKDADEDAESGRVYLPSGVPLATIHELAAYDLRQAETYVASLARAEAPLGFLKFCQLPLSLARGSLEKLAAEGAGAKLTRPEVIQIMTSLEDAIETTVASASADGVAS